METIQRFARSQGFSSHVARPASLAKRSSSRTGYQAKWTVNRQWCHAEGHSLSLVLLFLGWPTFFGFVGRGNCLYLGPFLGSRLLPDIWTSPASPLVISEARRLTANPVAYAEASCLTVHPVAFSEVLLSRLCRLLLRRVSTHSGARLLRGASPPGGPLRLLRGSSSHGDPRRLLKARLLQGITTS